MSVDDGGSLSQTAPVTDKVADGAQQAKDQIAQGAQQAKDQMSHGAGQAKESIVGQARQQIDDRTTQAGDQVSTMADVARRVSEALRDEGKDSHAKIADQAADRFERVGTYLRQADSSSLLDDLEDLGRRQPMALAAGGAVAGLLAARFLKASSTERSRTRSFSGGAPRSSGYADFSRDVASGYGGGTTGGHGAGRDAGFESTPERVGGGYDDPASTGADVIAPGHTSRYDDPSTAGEQTTDRPVPGYPTV